MSSEQEVQTETPPKPPYPYPPRGKGKKPFKLTEDPAYYRVYALKYYHAKRATPTHCENCGKLVCLAKMPRHIQTSICARNFKDSYEIESIKEAYRQSLLKEAADNVGLVFDEGDAEPQ